MPELPFLQVMAVAGLVAIVLVVLAMPLGSRLGPRAGHFVLRASLAGVLVTFGIALAAGARSGDLGRFSAEMGTGAWLQLGAFFLIVYGTGYRFVSSYLSDKRAKAKEAEDV